MRMSELWLSIPIVADQLKVTEKTVHNWIASGKLEAREEYHGRQRRRYIAHSKLEAFKATLPAQSTADHQ
jgi:transposase